MRQYLFDYIKAIRRNADVFMVGVFSTNVLPIAIYLHYTTVKHIEAVILLTIAHFCTQIIPLLAFPKFVNNQKIIGTWIAPVNFILHLVRMLCVALALYYFPSSSMNEIFLILCFFIVFDIFLVSLPIKIAVATLFFNAIVLTLAYTHEHAWLIFMLVFGAQVVTFTIHRTFQKMLTQKAELIQLNARIDQISTESERLRLRGDLHDTLGHELTALTIQVSMMQNEAEGSDAEGLALLKSRIKGLNTALRSIIENRHINHEMSVQEIIQQQVRRVPRLRVKTQLPDYAIILSPDQQRIMVSGVLELLTNCLKYSGSEQVNVNMVVDNNAVNLRVTNDIKHADHNKSPLQDTGLVSSSMGLLVLSERLTEVGGELHIARKQNRFEAMMMMPLDMHQENLKAS